MKSENFVLTLHMSHAAFDDAPISELTRVLRDLADRLDSGNADYDGAFILDVNGNTVGRYDFETRTFAFSAP